MEEISEYRLVPCRADWRIRIGEFGRHSKVSEEVTRRLNCDLK
jgi:hypothetical protein